MRICFSFASTEGEGYAGIIVSLPSNSEDEGKVGEARFPTAHLYFSSPVELPIELKENFYYLAKAFPFPLFYFFHKDFSVFALLPLFKRSQISALCMELVNNFPYFPLFSTPTSICVFFFFFSINSLHMQEIFMENAPDIRHSTSVGHFNGHEIQRLLTAEMFVFHKVIWSIFKYLVSSSCNTVRLLSSLFCPWETRGPDGWGDFLKVTQLINGRADLWNWAVHL